MANNVKKCSYLAFGAVSLDFWGGALGGAEPLLPGYMSRQLTLTTFDC